MAFWKKKRKKQASKASSETGPRKGGKRTPLDLKLAAMDGLAQGLNAREVAELIGVSDASIYKWRKLYEKEGVAELRKKASSRGVKLRCEALEARIIEKREEKPESGVRRIRDELRREEGLEVSAETVRKVVNEAGLQQPPQKSKRRGPQIRRFERALPNALWQIDIFTFQLKRMYPVYLVGIIDDHSRYIVGHGLFRQQKADAVLEVVKGAIGDFGAPREILSDNGRQFVAWRGKNRFQKVLTRQGLGHVRSAPHHPMTLGKIERFWKTLWTEYLEEAVFASFADCTQRLQHWIGYYNFRRPHQGINGACPADRFYGVANPIEEAVQQGCKENALQLALGQETQPPLYLLGQLGGTDVRVQRKGEEIEIRVGDKVHETIRLGKPYQMEKEVQETTEEEHGDMERDGSGGEIRSSPDGDEWQEAVEGFMRSLRDEPPDSEEGHSEGSGGHHEVPGAAEPRPQEQAPRPEESRDLESGESGTGKGGGPLEDEVGGDPHGPGPGAEGSSWRAPGWGGEKKEPGPQRAQAPAKEELNPELEEGWYDWDESEDGPWE